jgi:molybdopterin converting factor subunit 1
MKIRVLFFAHYRETVPGGQLELELPDGATVADAAAVLSERDARLNGILDRTRVAVAADFAEPDTPLKDGDELAFLPPMSGG